jgi:hypothetical protein
MNINTEEKFIERLSEISEAMQGIRNDIRDIFADKKSQQPEPKKPYVIEIKQHLEIYPHDLPETMTYVNAVKAVAALGDGWRIPTLEELRLIQKQHVEIGGFCLERASGSDYPDWYWSSTENRYDSSYVPDVRFLDGYEGWDRKDRFRLSCRPVRTMGEEK